MAHARAERPARSTLATWTMQPWSRVTAARKDMDPATGVQRQQHAKTSQTGSSVSSTRAMNSDE